MKRILLELPDSQFDRIMKQKGLDGYESKSWAEWLLSKGYPNIIEGEADQVQQGVVHMRKMWYSNIGHNLAYIRMKGAKSIRDLGRIEPEGSAVVVGAGPSLKSHDHLKVLKDSGYKGTIVSSDRMLVPLLQNGIVPNYVATVDGSDLIVPFYKNKWFRKHIEDVNVLLHFTAAPKLVRYLHRIKANIYWYIIHSSPIVTPDSDIMYSIYMTMSEHNPNGLPTLIGGGNVGVLCWNFSWCILKKNPVMLIGMDMGYPEGTPRGKTSYYSSIMKELTGKGAEPVTADLMASVVYEREYNPVWKTWSYTDVVFRQYRQIFQSYIEQSPSNIATINCTEGGTLNHRKLQNMRFAEALKKYRV